MTGRDLFLTTLIDGLKEKVAKARKAETIIFRDGGAFTIRVNGRWYPRITRDEAIRVLAEAGVRPLDADLDLYYAKRLPRYVDFEYRPVGRRKWICDGRTVTREGVVYGLQQAGFTREEIRVWLRIAKKLYELEASGAK